MKKNIKVLSAAGLAAVFAASAVVPTQAAVINHVVQDVDGKVFQYNQDDLAASFLAYKVNPELADALLYMDYLTTVTSNPNSRVAYEDDKNGYVTFKSANDAFLASKSNPDTQFSLNNFTESADAEKTTVESVIKVYVKDGAIVKEALSEAEVALVAAKAAVTALPAPEEVTVDNKTATATAVAVAAGLVADAKALGADVTALEASIKALEDKIAELEGEEPAPEVTVESVTAINATTFELSATFSKDITTEELTGKELTLTPGEGTAVKATFKSVAGKVATFTVDAADQAKLVNGAYSVSSTIADFSGKTTSFSKVITGNYVEGFIYIPNPVINPNVTEVPLAGATITVDGKTTTTDSRGYYKLAVTPGQKTVEVSKGTEYFVQELSAPVQRNYSTVVNADLEVIKIKELYLTGTVLDEANSAAVVGADAQLQAKNSDGNWENVEGFKATTSATGTYAFGNEDAVAVSPTKISADGDASTFAVAKANPLAVGTEYRVVIEKAVTAANLTDVYTKSEKSVTISNKVKETTTLQKVAKVAEITEFNVDVTWATGLTPAASEDLTFELLNQDGKEVNMLEAGKITVATESNKTKEKYDLVKNMNFANGTVSTGTTAGSAIVKPRLTSGTYFLRVTNAANAIAVVPVTVTEGGKVEVAVTIDKASSIQASGEVDKVQYRESLLTSPKLAEVITTNELIADGDVTTIKADGTRESAKFVDVEYNVYQTVAGKEIFVAKSAAKDKVKLATTGTDVSKVIDSLKTTGQGLDKLSANVSYNVKAESAYVTGVKEKTVKPDAATNNASFTDLLAATNVAGITLTDDATIAVPLAGKVSVNNIKLVKKDGTVVAETGKYTLDAMAAGAAITADAKVKALYAGFSSIVAGEYKLVVDVAGFKTKTTDLQKIYDFQDAEFSVALEAIKDTTITGYVRDAATGANIAVADAAAEASIIAYDDKGDAVAGVDFGKTPGSADETYTIISKLLVPGKEYTFVVRGNGFETKAIKRIVQAGEDNLALNFDVVKGGEGQFKLTMVDTNNQNLTGETVAVAGSVVGIPNNLVLSNANTTLNKKTSFVVTDSYFDVVLKTDDLTPAGVKTLAFTGESYLQNVGGAGTNARTFTSADLSAGSYKLVITDELTGSNKKYLTTTADLVINDINGTVYTTSNGVEVIKVGLVQANVADLNVNINLTLAGSAATNNVAKDVDYIEVLDVDGNVVKELRRSNIQAGTLDISVPNNATYTVKAYLNNGYVTSTIVTVQSYDQAATINVDQAIR